MKTIRSWHDLRLYGIDVLTGEACGLSYRFLCDVTDHGRKILSKCLGIGNLALDEAWNRGPAENPHVGSIMLTPEMLVPLGVFALLESGCRECWLFADQSLVGIEPTDPQEQTDLCRQRAAEAIARRFAYHGTAGDRNVHVMSGRVR